MVLFYGRPLVVYTYGPRSLAAVFERFVEPVSDFRGGMGGGLLGPPEATVGVQRPEAEEADIVVDVAVAVAVVAVVDVVFVVVMVVVVWPSSSSSPFSSSSSSS